MLSSDTFNLFPSFNEFTALGLVISFRRSADTDILRMRLTVVPRMSDEVISGDDDCFV